MRLESCASSLATANTSTGSEAVENARKDAVVAAMKSCSPRLKRFANPADRTLLAAFNSHER
jgi:hypothetical protein